MVQHYCSAILWLLVVIVLTASPLNAQSVQIIGDSVPPSDKTSRIWDRSHAVGTFVSSTVQAFGGGSPYIWTFTGSPPPELSFRDLGRVPPGSTQMISGSLNTPGSYSFGFKVTDRNGASATVGPFDLSVGPHITSINSSGATAGRPYTAALLVAGGTPLDGCSVSHPELQCTVSGNVLFLAGTFAVQGSNYSPFMQVSAPTENGIAYTTMSIPVRRPLAIGPNTNIDSHVSQNFSEVISTNETGTGPYSLHISAGKIPTGTVLEYSGSNRWRINGPLLAPGTFTYTVTMIDRWGSTASRDSRVVVADYPLLRITNAAPRSGVVGEYYSHRFDFEGVTPVRWSVSGALPEGLYLNPQGPELAGTPTSAGTSNFTLNAVDNRGRASAHAVTLTISPAVTLTHTRRTLPNATVGMPLSVQALAAGGTPPYRWSSANLPPGLTISESGLITGTVYVAVRQRFTLTVTDASNAALPAEYTMGVIEPIPTRTVRSGVVGELYDPNIGVRLPLPGGATASGAISFVIKSGSIPPGMVLNPSGTLNGIPRAAGVFSFVVAYGDIEGDGYLMPFSITIHPSPGVALYSVSNKGVAAFSTPGVGDALRVGHGRIVADRDNATPSASAFIEFRSGGVLISETTVPASAALREGRIFAEVSAFVNTGLALSSTRSEGTNNVDLTFTDASGRQVLRKTIVLPANTQVAGFLNQSPFDGPPEFLGTVLIQSTSPINVVALRGRINERADFLLTTLPLIPLTASSGPTVIPQFAAGAGWTTELVMVNPTGQTMKGTIEFFDSGSLASAPAPVSITVNGNTGVAFDYEIPPTGVHKLTATSIGGVQVGSVRVSPWENSFTPSGVLTYSFRPAGITLSETGLGIGQVADSYRLFVENNASSRIQTGFALANASPSPSPVELILTDPVGVEVGRTSIILPGNGQIARYVHEMSELRMPPNFRGLLTASSPSKSIVISGIRGRYNERGDYFETTVAPVDSSAPAGAVTISGFPHLVDGGGYKTRIVIFSGTPEQTGSGFLRIFDRFGDGSDMFQAEP